MNFDTIILNFVSDNSLTLMVSFATLKGIAKITPWAWDDSVISLFAGVFKSINPSGREQAEK